MHPGFGGGGGGQVLWQGYVYYTGESGNNSFWHHSDISNGEKWKYRDSDSESYWQGGNSLSEFLGTPGPTHDSQWQVCYTTLKLVTFF